MGNSHYLIRLDDACPTMDKQRWNRIESILDSFGVKPMVGVIPANADPKQKVDKPDPNFWAKVKNWEDKGWAIALHGYDHLYISNNGGINPLWNRSEFAGVALEEQKEKIRKGVEILKSKGLNPKYFFAPSHTFDLNTLKALDECTDIRIISDTIATKPYKWNGFIFIPQIGGHCRDMKFNGIWTFCLHPSGMDENAFKNLEKFLLKNQDKFTSFSNIDYDEIIKDKGMIDKLLSFIFFFHRKANRLLQNLK